MSTARPVNMMPKKRLAEQENTMCHNRKQAYDTELQKVYESTSPMKTKLQPSFFAEELALKPLAHMDSVSTSNSVGKLNKPIFMAICGGPGSGKTFICKWIKRHFAADDTSVCILKEKNFLMNVDVAEGEDASERLQAHDFDNPQAVDWSLFEKAAGRLADRKPFNTPIYDLCSNKRIIRTKRLDASDIVLIEGRLILQNEYLRSLCNVRVFLETDADVMLSRRVFKGLARNMDLNAILDKYLAHVKPNYEKYVEPSKACADLVVQNFGGCNFAIEQFEGNYEIISILQDLLTVRLSDSVVSESKDTQEELLVA